MLNRSKRVLSALAGRAGSLLARRAEHLGDPDILCVVDSLGWVQQTRIENLAKYQDKFRLAAITGEEFAKLWKKGRMRNRAIYFASWRIPLVCEKSHGCVFQAEDFRNFMTSVTSHYNIGGIADPFTAIPRSADPQETFNAATQLLRKFEVVTANSLTLHNLLRPHVTKIMYAPNGVDADFFCPNGSKAFEPERIRVGWVGKIKRAKNFGVMNEAMRVGELQGIEMRLIAQSKDASPEDVLPPSQVRDFYGTIDYYLCASWHEGTPNPALEAAACGVPPITTRVGNMPEFVRDGENGFFIEPTVDSIVSCMERIRKFTGNDHRALSAGVRSAILAEWTWEKKVENYLVAFDRLMGRGGANR